MAVTAIPLSKVTGLSDALANKVDAVEGKVLSSNDFTNELLNKLNGIASNAQVNVLEAVQLNGVALEIVDKAVNIPLATTSSAGMLSSTDKVKLDAFDPADITEMQSDINELRSSVTWGTI